MNSIFVIHCASTWALVGLIWTVQVSLYPLFRKVGRESFAAYYEAHMRRITWVVAPLMSVELGTAAWLFLMVGFRDGWFILSLVPLALNWISTALVQVPMHRKLERGGYDEALIGRLVHSNWIRTLAWTVRGLLLVLLARAMNCDFFNAG